MWLTSSFNQQIELGLETLSGARRAARDLQSERHLRCTVRVVEREHCAVYAGLVQVAGELSESDCAGPRDQLLVAPEEQVRVGLANSRERVAGAVRVGRRPGARRLRCEQRVQPQPPVFEFAATVADALQAEDSELQATHVLTIQHLQMQPQVFLRKVLQHSCVNQRLHEVGPILSKSYIQ